MTRKAGKQELPRTKEGMKRVIPLTSKAGRRNQRVRNEIFSQDEKDLFTSFFGTHHDLVNNH